MLNGLAIILGLIQVTILGCYFIIIFVKNLLFGRWRQVLSVAVAPILAFTMFYYQAKYEFTPEYIQFKMMQHFYIAEARKSGVADATFYAWYWGGARGPVISSIYAVLIYDETDQIALQPGARTADWVAKVNLFASKSDLELLPILSPERYYTKQTGVSIKKMADHFYVVTES